MPEQPTGLDEPKGEAMKRIALMLTIMLAPAARALTSFADSNCDVPQLQPEMTPKAAVVSA